MAIICALHDKRSRNNKRFFFSKPHLNPELVIKTRKISSGIDSHTINAFVLKSKISNDGRRSSQNTRINIKIDGITDGLEPHPWIVIGTDGDYAKPKQIQEITIMRDEHAQTHIATLIPANNYAVVNTLNNREGYALELGKQYDVTISVTGDLPRYYETKIKWRI